MRNRKLSIAIWEWKEKIRRKSFFIFSIAFPILVVAMSIIPFQIDSNNMESSPEPVAVIDHTSEYFNYLNHEIENEKLKFVLINYCTIPHEIVNNHVTAIKDLNSGLIRFFIEIDSSNSGGLIISLNTSSEKDEAAQSFLLFIEKSIYRKALRNSTNNISLQTKIVPLADGEKRDEITVFIQSFAFLIFFTALTLTTGGTFTRGMVEEKSSGIMEILLSSCSVKDIFYGKLYGIVLTACLHIIIWIAAGVIYSSQLFVPYSSFILKMIYFLMGYLIYGAIFLSGGSLMKTEYEAQQLSTLLSFILIIPVLLSFSIIIDPNSWFTIFLTYFPLTTVPVMLIKLSLNTFNFIEIILTAAISISFLIIVLSIGSNLYKRVFSKGTLIKFNKIGVK